MPFKSKKQEIYLRINNPELYKEWVRKYGHFSKSKKKKKKSKKK